MSVFSHGRWLLLGQGTPEEEDGGVALDIDVTLAEPLSALGRGARILVQAEEDASRLKLFAYELRRTYRAVE